MNWTKEDLREFLKRWNELKQKAEQKFKHLKDHIENKEEESQSQELDLTAPAEPGELGSTHPITITLNRIIDIFSKVGFAIAEDREIEDDL